MLNLLKHLYRPLVQCACADESGTRTIEARNEHLFSALIVVGTHKWGGKVNNYYSVITAGSTDAEYERHA